MPIISQKVQPGGIEALETWERGVLLNFGMSVRKGLSEVLERGR